MRVVYLNYKMIHKYIVVPFLIKIHLHEIECFVIISTKNKNNNILILVYDKTDFWVCKKDLKDEI